MCYTLKGFFWPLSVFSVEVVASLLWCDQLVPPKRLPATVDAIKSCVRYVAPPVWDTVSLVTELLLLCFPQQSG